MTRHALAHLEAVDRHVRAAGPAWRTLDPCRTHASSLRSIGERLLACAGDEALAQALANMLERVVLSQLEHFAENLFWDFDYLAACAFRTARQSPDGERVLAELGDELHGLFSVYGSRSPIRFRYVHDFVYGLDWERWVQRDPGGNAAIGPFDRAYLRRVRARGRELCARIASGGDASFVPLAAGEYRNPFPFSRTPEHELLLHRALAARGLLPVDAWRLDARPNWERRTTRRRVELARELGIPFKR